MNNRAVTSESGQVLTFFPSTSPSESGWGRLGNQKNYGTNSGIKIGGISIDDYLKEAKIQRVDVMKVDVEGAEEQVLLGAANSLNIKKNQSCSL